MLGVLDAKQVKLEAGRIICAAFQMMLLRIAEQAQMMMLQPLLLPPMVRLRQMAFFHWDTLAPFVHCLRLNMPAVAHLPTACAESLVPWQMA